MRPDNAEVRARGQTETLQLREKIALLHLANFSNPKPGAAQSHLAFIYFLQGDYARAELEGKKALASLRKILGPQHATTLGTAVTVGLSLTRNGKAAEGEPYLRELPATREKMRRRAMWPPLIPRACWANA